MINVAVFAALDVAFLYSAHKQAPAIITLGLFAAMIGWLVFGERLIA